jgi:ABC-type nitrate/sulfonate/bicarbonate transport system permease component
MKMHHSIRYVVQQWWLVLLILGLWQTTSSLGLSGNNLLPSPSEVLNAGVRMITKRVLFVDVGNSLLRILSGFALATVFGVGFGLALAVLSNLAKPFRNLIEILRPIPPIAWIPLAILWFGIGNGSAIFIVALSGFFPIFLTTFDAIQNVEMSYINTARCLGASKRLLLTNVLLPAAAPQILIGLRVGLGVAWTSLIAAELVGAQSGLGYMIQLNRMVLQMENVIVGMIIIGLIGFLMNRLAYLAENTLVPWSDDTLRAWGS